MLSSAEITARITRYGCCALTELNSAVESETFGDTACAKKHRRLATWLTWAQGIMCGTVTDTNPDGCYTVAYATQIARKADCFCDCGCGSTDPCTVEVSYTVQNTATVSDREIIMDAGPQLGDSYLLTDPNTVTDGTWTGGDIVTWNGTDWTVVVLQQGEVASINGVYWVTNGVQPGLMYPTVTTVFSSVPVNFSVVSDYPWIAANMDGSAAVQILTPSSTTPGLEWVTVLTIAASLLATQQTIGLAGFPAVAVRVVYTDSDGCVGISGNGGLQPPPSCVIDPNFQLDNLDEVPSLIQVGDIVTVNGEGNNQYYMWDGIEFDAMFPPITYGPVNGVYMLMPYEPNNLNTTAGTAIIELEIDGNWITVFSGNNATIFAGIPITPLPGVVTGVRTTYVRGNCVYLVTGTPNTDVDDYTPDVCGSQPQVLNIIWNQNNPPALGTYLMLIVNNPTGVDMNGLFLPGSLFDAVTPGNGTSLVVFDGPIETGSFLTSVVVPGVPGESIIDLFPQSLTIPSSVPEIYLYAQPGTLAPVRTYANGQLDTPVRMMFTCVDAGAIEVYVDSTTPDCETQTGTMSVAAVSAGDPGGGLVDIRYSLDGMVTWIDYTPSIVWNELVSIGPFPLDVEIYLEFSDDEGVIGTGYSLGPITIVGGCECVPTYGLIGLKFRDVIDYADLPDPNDPEYVGGYVYIEEDSTGTCPFEVPLWIQALETVPSSGIYAWTDQIEDESEEDYVIWIGVDGRAWYMPPGPPTGPLTAPEPYALSVVLTGNEVAGNGQSNYVIVSNRPYRVDVLVLGVWVPVWYGIEDTLFGLNRETFIIDVQGAITGIRGVVDYDTCPVYLPGIIA
jgi:hypothetical protein